MTTLLLATAMSDIRKTTMLRKTILKKHGSEKEPATEATMLSVPDVASVLVSSEDRPAARFLSAYKRYPSCT